MHVKQAISCCVVLLFCPICSFADESGNICVQASHQDLYPDSSDCHWFYQCVYTNETHATAYRRKCATGLFWREQVLQCLPEGETPCTDRCLADATSAKGCYAGTGCRQFFVCAHTASYGMCCPPGTRFNEPTCSCIEDTACSDPCVQKSPPVQTSIAPPRSVNATACVDSYGTLISTVSEKPNAYYLLDEFGQAVEKMLCPDRVIFDLVTCRCDIQIGIPIVSGEKNKGETVFWTPFDEDTKDHSPKKFATFLYNGAQRDAMTSAMGAGSLVVRNGGYLSIPGLKTFDLRNSASFCAFFKCDNATTCSNGSILSNYMGENDYTVAMETHPKNTLTARLHFWHPVGVATVNSTFSPDDWNHVCLTYDGSAVRLYLNDFLVDGKLADGYLAVSNGPFRIGSFNGHIDDVRIASFAMSEQESRGGSAKPAPKIGDESPRRCNATSCHCVDSQGEYADYDTPISEAANMTCKCARDKADYIKLHIIGLIFSCDNLGNYEKIQCLGSVCYCVDENGHELPNSPMVPISEFKKLIC